MYAKKTPTKWGIKAWVLVDFRTGYVHNLQLYSGNSIVVPVQVISNVIKNIGKDNDTPVKGLAHRVVLSLSLFHPLFPSFSSPSF